MTGNQDSVTGNRLITYVGAELGLDESLTLDAACEILKEAAAGARKGFWINFQGVTRQDIEAVSAVAGIHPLNQKDILDPAVREKWEDFEGYLYIVGHGLNFNKGREVLNTIHVSFLLFDDFILTFHSENLKSKDAVVETIKTQNRGILPSPEWVLYSFLNALTNLYLNQVDVLVEEVDDVDHQVLVQKNDKLMLERISQSRRKLLHLRRRLTPKRDFLQLLCMRDQERINHDTQLLMRDVLNHVLRMQEMVEMARETLASAQANYLAQVSNRMNEVMKTLSIVATIMLPLTFLTGLFGMNVHVPGQEAGGYVWFVALVFAMSFMVYLLYLYFKKQDWI